VQAASQSPEQTIAYFATGGTISAKGSEHTYHVGVLTGAECLEGIKMPPNTHVEVEDVASIDSKDLSAAHLHDLRNAVATRLQDKENPAKAAVITHGSDTISTTAFYLQATLPRDLLAEKKIVLTASMKPSDVANPDGPGNLGDALALARSDKGRGVLATLAHQIYAPPGFDKKHTTSIHAFKTVNAKRVGTVRNGKVKIENEPPLPPRTFDPGPTGKLPVVTVIYSEPGVDPQFTVNTIRSAFKNGAEGIVYAGTGNGTINEVVATELKKQAAEDRLVIRSTKVGNGEVIRNGAFQDDEHGTASSGTLGPDQARLLAQLAIAHEKHAHSDTPVNLARIRQVFDDYQSPGARPQDKAGAANKT
jgi:L-asparaginase